MSVGNHCSLITVSSIALSSPIRNDAGGQVLSFEPFSAIRALHCSAELRHMNMHLRSATGTADGHCKRVHCFG